MMWAGRPRRGFLREADHYQQKLVPSIEKT